MKILWIVNMLLPDAAEYLGVKTGFSGTWMINMSREIAHSDDVELAIACVYGDTFKDFTVNNIRYFCIPGNGKTMLFYNEDLIKYWDMIEERFCPDIVNFHGTEYSHGVSYLRKYKDKKKVLTIQGVMGKIAPKRNGELPLSVLLKYRTLKEWLHFNGMIEQQYLFNKNVKYETEIIKSMQYVTGRTDWDKYYMQSINPDIKYFRCYYDLREEFYHADRWNIDHVNRNVIFASNSAQAPMKGGHIVIEALNLVKRKIPDVKAIFLASKQENGKLIPNSGYTKYIADLIKKYNLEENVQFVSGQRADGVIDLMTHSHITVIPSAIENASATLREAMHLGSPCISAFRGGMTELVDNGKNGFLYDYTEYEFLAGRIVELLKDDKLAIEFSKNSIEKSSCWHNKEKNKNDYIQMYKEIFKD